MKKMYIVLNQDLKMSKGLACAQVAHAVFDYINSKIEECCIPAFDYDICDNINKLRSKLDSFRYNGNQMIVLKEDAGVLNIFKERGFVTVIDRDLGGIITAVNLGIYDDKEVPGFIKEMKLF